MQLFSFFVLFFYLTWKFGLGLAANPLAKEHSDLREEGLFPFSEQKNEESSLTITVVGASGDLAKKKIFPALFALYYEDCLPEVLSLDTVNPFFHDDTHVSKMCLGNG